MTDGKKQARKIQCTQKYLKDTQPPSMVREMQIKHKDFYS